MGVYFIEENPETIFDRIFRFSPILPTIISLVMIFTGFYYISEPCPNYAAPIVNVLCGLTSLASAGILWLSNFGPRIGMTSFQIGTLWIAGVLVGQFSQFVGYYQIMRKQKYIQSQSLKISRKSRTLQHCERKPKAKRAMFVYLHFYKCQLFIYIFTNFSCLFTFLRIYFIYICKNVNKQRKIESNFWRQN